MIPPRHIEQSIGIHPENDVLSMADWDGSKDIDQTPPALISKTSLLSSTPYYPPDHPWTRRLQGLLDRVSGGDPEAKMYLLDTDNANALALPDKTVAFTRGLLQELKPESEEELLGIIGHEWIHISRQHSKKRNKDHELKYNPLGKLGFMRRGEIEADLLAARHLDQAGINPIGLVVALEKIARLGEERGARTDFVHGSTTDRVLNLKEAGRLEDARHLGDPLNPLGLPLELLDDVPNDVDRWAEVDTMSVEDLLYFTLRQFNNALGDRSGQATSDHESVQLVQAIGLLKSRVFPAFCPELTEDQQDILIELIAAENHRTLQDLGSTESATGFKFDDSNKLASLAALIEGDYIDRMGLEIKSVGDITSRALSQAVETDIFGHIDDQSFTFDINLFTRTAMRLSQAAIIRSARQGEHSYFPTAEVGNGAVMVIFEHFKPYADVHQEEWYRAADIVGDLVLHMPSLSNYIGDSISTKDNVGAEALRERKRGSIDLSPTYERYADFYYIIEGKQNRLTKEIASPYSRYAESAIRSTDTGMMPQRGLIHEMLMGRPFGSIFEDFAQWWQELPTHLQYQYFLVANQFRKMLNAYPDELKDYGYTSEELDTADDVPAEYDDVVDFRLGHNLIRDIVTRRTQEPDDLLTLLAAVTPGKLRYLYNFNRRVDIHAGKKPTVAMLLEVGDMTMRASERRSAAKFLPDWVVRPRDFRLAPNYLGGLKFELFRELHGLRKDPATAHALIASVIQQRPIFDTQAVPVLRYGDDGEVSERTVDQRADLLEQYTNWYRSLFRSEGGRDWDLDDPNQLQALFHLSCLAENPMVLYRLPNNLFQRFVGQHDFSEGLRLITQEYAHMPPVVTSGGFRELVDHGAKTLDEFAQLDSTADNFISATLGDQDRLATAAVVDVLSDEYFTSGLQFLSAMLESGTNDQALRNYVAVRWFRASRGLFGGISGKNYFDMNPLSLARMPGKAAVAQRWYMSVPERGELNFRPFNDVINSLYLMDDTMKYVLMRRLLVGQHGVLRNSQSRSALASDFADNHMTFENEQEAERMRQILTAVVDTDDIDELYLNLNPILMALILHPPKKQNSIESTAIVLAQHELARLASPNRPGGPLFSDITERDTSMAAMKIRNLMLGEPILTESSPRPKPDPEMALLRTVPQTKERRFSEKLAPWDLALTVAEYTPAGAKIAQKAQLYIDVPDDVRPRALKVFDRVPGQSRLSVYRALMREAQYSPQIAEYLNQIAAIDDTIGGGSLFTVVRVIRKDGRREALAVRNPNAEYRSTQAIQFYKGVIQRLMESDSDNRTYPLVDMLLDDLTQIISAELNDGDYVEKNKQFRSHNHGYRASSKNQYSIYIPEVYETGSLWLYRDEEVDGTNLTGLEVVDGSTDILAGHISQNDYKRVVNLLVRNLKHQVETGLVHSDFTPGQFRVTPDNQRVAVFDRRNLIELTPQEKGFFQAIETAGIAGVQHAVTVFIDHMLTYAENSEYRSQRSQLVGNVLQAHADRKSDLAVLVRSAREAGLYIPVHLEQIFLNFIFVDQMAREAGFSNLVEAYTHESDSVTDRFLGAIAKKRK